VPQLPAAILIQPDKPHPDKQWAVCFEYAEVNGFDAPTICHHWQACMSLVLDGAVTAVITAVDPGPEVMDALETAGATVCVAREAPPSRLRRDISELAVTLHKAGVDTQEMSRMLRVDMGYIRRILYRAGIGRRKSRE
jgi:hypothetical protein